MTLNIAVLTLSDRRTLESDTSGDCLVARLKASGHRLADRQLIPDDRYLTRAVISQWIADPKVDAIVSTGGTGLTGRDGTPEAVAPLLDKVIDGFGELFRALSYQDIGTSTLQSRCLAGIANGTFIFCLPGSTGACETAWDKIIHHQLNSDTKPCNLAMLAPRLKEK
ncbi:molybdenum cofactor biosynthesis protein B [gamma proteobacterium HTCC5015]|nr:molybdenum cofactor biosynthesis protein B [gamma proteobacterium HTCC5015]